MSSENLHVPRELLSQEARLLHNAITSLMEELEAVDWYNQRVDAATDDDLRAILAHNRDEEIEHAMMALEYLRRVNPVFDKHMRTYLFTEGDITGIEEKAEQT
jgi:ferritin-like protein